jgi:imidazolonepropionase-like amidohydrolase
MLAASQLKMSAAEILCASTFNAAAALGLEKSHGVIAPARVGNVLLFPVDDVAPPLEQLMRVVIARRPPTAVIVRGRALIDYTSMLIRKPIHIRI